MIQIPVKFHYVSKSRIDRSGSVAVQGRRKNVASLQSPTGVPTVMIECGTVFLPMRPQSQQELGAAVKHLYEYAISCAIDQDPQEVEMEVYAEDGGINYGVIAHFN